VRETRKSEGGGERQLPIGIRRDVDRERKAGLVSQHGLECATQWWRSSPTPVAPPRLMINACALSYASLNWSTSPSNRAINMTATACGTQTVAVIVLAPSTVEVSDTPS
jgi:hypothetical protein